MKSREGSWTLVIVGKWNKHILNPGWVGKNIFEEEKVKVEFPVNSPDLPPRYTTKDNIIFLPGNHRINFIAQTPYNDKELNKICSMSRNLVKILKHTPITGLGINFGFEEHHDHFELLELFSIKDNDKFVDVLDATPEQIEVKRQFNFPDYLLNLSLNYFGETVSFDFNYHYSISDNENLVDILIDELFIKRKNTTLQIMKDIYGLEIEEEQQ